MNIGLNEYLALSGLLFAIGFFGVLLRKNTLIIFMCLELMLVAEGALRQHQRLARHAVGLP